MARLTDRSAALPLLPVQAIGSAGIPAWMWLVRDAVAEGKLGPSDIEESLKDGVEISLLDMREAGYDIVSDGEMLRADFTRNFHGRINGLEAIDYERRLGYPGPDQLDAFRAVGPLSVPDGYAMVREVEHLLSRTDKPFVSALQGPVTQAFRIDPGAAYGDKGKVAWALVPFINAELKAAVAAGATLIQLDEPAFWIMPGGLPEMVDDHQRLPGRASRPRRHCICASGISAADPPRPTAPMRPSRPTSATCASMRSRWSSPTARCGRPSCGPSTAATRSWWPASST